MYESVPAHMAMSRRTLACVRACMGDCLPAMRSCECLWSVMWVYLNGPDKRQTKPEALHDHVKKLLSMANAQVGFFLKRERDHTL
jgi:hypothetical protein